MPRSSLSRLVCALLVVTILSAAPLVAAEPARPAAPHAAGLASLWGWLVGLWGEEGCYIDPDGRCRDGASGMPSVPESVDEGCYIDPSGGCLGGR